MTGLYDRDLLDALARNTIGRPADVCDWRDLLRVRDVVDELLSAAINERQLNSASTSPADRQLERDPSGSQGSERVT